MADEVPQTHVQADEDEFGAPISDVEPNMDIHKPKLWHGLREFLKEYVIVVAGVLTALAGGQAVEWLHWRHVSEQTEQGLDVEVRSDLEHAADRLSWRGCLQARLADLRDKLVATDGPWKADPVVPGPGAPPAGPREAVRGHVMPFVYGLPFFSFSHQAWDAAHASDALSHLPSAKLAFYSAFYEEIEHLNGWQAAEKEAAVRLAPLSYETRLDPSERDAQIANLAAADDNAFYINQFSRILIETARGQDLRPNPGKVARWIQDSRGVLGACVVEPSA